MKNFEKTVRFDKQIQDLYKQFDMLNDSESYREIRDLINDQQEYFKNL